MLGKGRVYPALHLHRNRLCFLPAPLFLLRGKEDLGAGKERSLNSRKSGRYEIPCAELCGFGHSGMKGWLTVLSAEDYQEWVQERWPSTEAKAPSSSAAS